MAMGKRSNEMSFEEFKQAFRDMCAAFGTTGILREIDELLRSGCSEADAKRWIAARIWDFPEPLRNQLVMAFATEALRESAEQAEPPMTKEEENRRFMEIWKTRGFPAAREWEQQQRAKTPLPGGGR